MRTTGDVDYSSPQHHAGSQQCSVHRFPAAFEVSSSVFLGLLDTFNRTDLLLFPFAIFFCVPSSTGPELLSHLCQQFRSEGSLTSLSSFHNNRGREASRFLFVLVPDLVFLSQDLSYLQSKIRNYPLFPVFPLNKPSGSPCYEVLGFLKRFISLSETPSALHLGLDLKGVSPLSVLASFSEGPLATMMFIQLQVVLVRFLMTFK